MDNTCSRTCLSQAVLPISKYQNHNAFLNFDSKNICRDTVGQFVCMFVFLISIFFFLHFFLFLLLLRLFAFADSVDNKHVTHTHTHTHTHTIHYSTILQHATHKTQHIAYIQHNHNMRPFCLFLDQLVCENRKDWRIVEKKGDRTITEEESE